MTPPPVLPDLLGTLRAHLPQLRERYAVRQLGVFGSYVRGEQTPESDLDVLVEFERTPTLFDVVELEHRLSELLGLKVDVVMRSALKPTLGRQILQEVVRV